jgi:hypothetical protein
MRRVRLVAVSLLATFALLVGSVVFAQDAATTGLQSVEPYMVAVTAPQYGVLPARLRVWQN